MSLLECVVVEPPEEATATIIWLHGLGASGHDFEPVVPHLGLDENIMVRFLFPHAPSIPVTINNGFTMPAWYDIYSTDLNRELDEVGLRASVAAIRALIINENTQGIAANRIIIAGFSQGGAVGLELALTHPEPLAGLVALSTYFATYKSIELDEANSRLPIFVGHGEYDPMVPVKLGEQTREKLLEWGYPLEYKTYPIEHSVDMQEIRDIGIWINERLS
tara:strand:+ start:73 stop:732 length:660 start_codon:yes stop_codon:yes gene_type:complete